MNREDSGTIPLTRDGGFKMIQTELAIFEEKRLVPAINSLKTAIASNDEKTDESTTALKQLRGAIKGVLFVNSILGLFWITMQIYKAAIPR